MGSGVGATVIVGPSITTSSPIERRMSAVMPTSPTAGALVMVDGESPIRAATMCLVTAFFDPATWTSPRSGPLGSMCQTARVSIGRLGEARGTGTARLGGPLSQCWSTGRC